MAKMVKKFLSIIIGSVIGSLITIFLLKATGFLNGCNQCYDEISYFRDSVSKVYDAVVAVEGYQDGKVIASGSGTIYKNENGFGYIITNYHVIDQADVIRVINNDGKVVDATLVGSDAYSDFAVVKVPDVYVMDVAMIGNSDQIEIGDAVFTVGSPIDRKYIGSVTRGIISGLNRKITVTYSGSSSNLDVIQIDAAINPGNSGGPLCNINGEVIGINSLKLSQEEVEGIAFALPIEYVMSIVSRLE